MSVRNWRIRVHERSSMTLIYLLMALLFWLPLASEVGFVGAQGASMGQNTIYRFDTDVPGMVSGPISIAGAFGKELVAMIFGDSSSELYIANRTQNFPGANGIYKITLNSDGLNGTATLVAETPGSNNGLSGIARHPQSGKIFACNQSFGMGTPGIYSFDPSGSTPQTMILAYDTVPITAPTGIAFDGDFCYFTNVGVAGGDNAIFKVSINPDGTIPVQAAIKVADVPGNGAALIQIHEGNIYVANFVPMGTSTNGIYTTPITSVMGIATLAASINDPTDKACLSVAISGNQVFATNAEYIAGVLPTGDSAIYSFTLPGSGQNVTTPFALVPTSGPGGPIGAFGVLTGFVPSPSKNLNVYDIERIIPIYEDLVEKTKLILNDAGL